MKLASHIEQLAEFEELVKVHFGAGDLDAVVVDSRLKFEVQGKSPKRGRIVFGS